MERKDNMTSDYYVNNTVIYNSLLKSTIIDNPLSVVNITNPYNQRLNIWNNEDQSYHFVDIQFTVVNENNFRRITDLAYINYDFEEREESVEHWTECGF